MISTYILPASKLDNRVIKDIHGQFNGKIIKITVTECDETEYLLSNKANRKRLQQSLDDANNRRNLIEVDLNDLEDIAVLKSKQANSSLNK